MSGLEPGGQLAWAVMSLIEQNDGSQKLPDPSEELV